MSVLSGASRDRIVGNQSELRRRKWRAKQDVEIVSLLSASPLCAALRYSDDSTTALSFNAAEEDL
jgi:hypothetical protein